MIKNREQLKEILDAKGVDQSRYSLFGGSNWADTKCLDKRKGNWAVYYVERGREYDEKTFSSEAEACKYLYDWILEEFERPSSPPPPSMMQ